MYIGNAPAGVTTRLGTPCSNGNENCRSICLSILKILIRGNSL